MLWKIFKKCRPFDIAVVIMIAGILITVLVLTTAGRQEVKLSKRSSTRIRKRDDSGADLAALASNSYNDTTAKCGYADLDRILIERVPGTSGNKEVREYLVGRLKSLDWEVELDTFTDATPKGSIEFSNIVGYSTKDAKKYIVLTAHYDSKLFPPQPDGRKFVGATDSAVPIAIILNLLDNLNSLLKKKLETDSQLGLMVVFFDGEEAFVEWTASDSVYGSRHLAAKWDANGFLKKIDTFVLLDLIGYKNPTFKNYNHAAQDHFIHLNKIEKKTSDLLESYTGSQQHQFFPLQRAVWPVEDDHIPFQERGVRNIVHIIATPFPPVWHKIDDDAEHLHCPSIRNVQKIVQVWVAELFQLYRLIHM